METATLTQTSQEIDYPLDQVVLIPVDKLKLHSNSRYGWDDGTILAAFDDGIETIVASIKDWGYLKSHPVTFWVEEDGRLSIVDGHRRSYAAKKILAEDSNYVFTSSIDDEPGYIWGMRVEKPQSIVDYLASQSRQNESLENTSMDWAKMLSIALAQPEYNGKPQGVSHVEVAQKLGFRKDINPNANEQKKRVLTKIVRDFTRVNRLPSAVKDWIQTGEVLHQKDDLIRLECSTAISTIEEYGESASKILLEVLRRCEESPQDVINDGGVHGTRITKKYIDGVAQVLGISNKAEKKEKKRKTTDSAEAAITSESQQPNSTNLAPNNDHDEVNEPKELAPSFTESSSERTNKPTSSDSKHTQIEKIASTLIKSLKGEVGLMLAGIQLENGAINFPPLHPDDEAKLKEWWDNLQSLIDLYGNSAPIEEVQSTLGISEDSLVPDKLDDFEISPDDLI